MCRRGGFRAIVEAYRRIDKGGEEVAEQGSQRTAADGGIDLAEVARLVAAIEHDLARLPPGAGNVQALRDEVAALKRILDSAAPGAGPVSHRLRNIHSMLQEALDTVVEDAIKGADYVRRIGGMLGM